MSQSPRERGSTTGLTESERHRILASERRRETLDFLATWTTPIELDELATAVATRESDATAPSCDAVERVAVVLHHQHLPLLSAWGAIDYDPASRRIESVDVTADLVS